MSKTNDKTIIYVNYSPYENSGKILDFLLENFLNVCVFSIGFYNLTNKKNYNKLEIYNKGKLKKTYSLFQLPISSKFLFISIPLRSIITFFEIFFYVTHLSRRYKKIDLYFTVNAFTAWIGIILKKFGLVRKTVFWVWDYYPPIHDSKIVMLMRYIYWQFDRVSSHSDIVAFVNNRLLDLRRDIGIYPDKIKYPIIPIGTDKFPFRFVKKGNTTRALTFGFIGVIKRSQGLDIVINNAQLLKKEFGEVIYCIVGSGPDEKYFKKKALESKLKVKFYGYLEGDSFNEVLKKCDIGIATYKPDPSNVSLYGDPGKIKRYIGLGIPVITTNIPEISEVIEKSSSGVIIEYDNQKAFIEAVKKIMKKHNQYRKNAHKLGQKYYYKKIYPEMFGFK